MLYNNTVIAIVKQTTLPVSLSQHVYCQLHSLLPFEKRRKVFNPPSSNFHGKPGYSVKLVTLWAYAPRVKQFLCSVYLSAKHIESASNSSMQKDQHNYILECFYTWYKSRQCFCCYCSCFPLHCMCFLCPPISKSRDIYIAHQQSHCAKSNTCMRGNIQWICSSFLKCSLPKQKILWILSTQSSPLLMWFLF